MSGGTTDLTGRDKQHLPARLTNRLVLASHGRERGAHSLRRLRVGGDWRA